MKDSKIIEVCERYKKKLNEVYFDDISYHTEWMLRQIPKFLKEKRREKVNRWLGFIQGVLWSKNVYTLEEMKDHNRPQKNSSYSIINKKERNGNTKNCKTL